MLNNTNFLITTPIFYTNGKLHIGHLYSILLSDFLKKYNFYNKSYNEIFFLTGTDEHGDKIYNFAKNTNININEFLDNQVFEIKKLWKLFNVDYDFFIRTTNNNHVTTVQKILNNFYNKKLIYKSIYKKYYCIHCEESFTTEYFKNKKKCSNCNREIKYIEDEAYFLKIKNEKKWIIKTLTKKDFIYPRFIIKELRKNFLDNDFHDLCISRKNINWGIPLPFDKKHKTYVWFDALINYLSSMGYLNNFENKMKNYWNNKDSNIYLTLGKEIARFHCIYFPIILKYLNIRLPNKIICHGLLKNNDIKMSKSKNNYTNPIDVLKNYNSDIVRYSLLRTLNIKNDVNFSISFFQNISEKIIINIISNLYIRVNRMIKKYYNFSINNLRYKKNTFLFNSERENVFNLYKDFKQNIKNFKINLAILKIEELAAFLNKQIEIHKPWIIKNKSKLNDFFLFLIWSLSYLTFMLNPVLIKKIKAINDAFNFKYKKIKISSIYKLKIKFLPLLYEKNNLA